MSRIFAYIVHKAGIADDSAPELAAAAKKIDPCTFLNTTRSVESNTSTIRPISF